MDMKKGGCADFFVRLIRRYIDDEIGMSAAALVYYMVFSFFPVVIVLSMILGFADIDIASVTEEMSRFMPADVIDIVEMYLVHVSQIKNRNILAVSLFFTVYFPVRAVNYIMLGIDKAYGKGTKRPLHKKVMLTSVFSLIIIFNVYVSFILLAAGRRVLEFVSYIITIPLEFIDVWVYLRFLIMASVAAFSVTTLYVIAPQKKVTFAEALPGAVSAVSLWVIVSAVFSIYVEKMGKYSVLFGSVAAVIVLLLWLYITAVILLMGAEINAVLCAVNDEKTLINKHSCV